MKMKVFLVAGARPNFMKIAPIYHQMKLSPDAFEPIIVHTGQHYNDNMSKIFFEELKLPPPDAYLDVGSGSHAQQTAEIMKRFERQLIHHKPELVVVVGDVNSTIACALTAVKCRIPHDTLRLLWECYEKYMTIRKSDSRITQAHNLRNQSHEAPILGHVEAGERSYDYSMPEEINRVTTDVLSDLLFTTSEDSTLNLIDEGIDPRKIHCVGNVIIDSLQRLLPKAKNSAILDSLYKQEQAETQHKIGKYGFVLVTLHRPGNVDDPGNLRILFSALLHLSKEIPIIFPMHPRTHKLLSSLDAEFIEKIYKSCIIILEPVGYLDFLYLQSKARMILTDSGGVQVESTYLGIPCLTLRDRTEWQITLREGTNSLVPLHEKDIVDTSIKTLKDKKKSLANIEYWDGKAAERIVAIIEQIVDFK